LAVHGPQRVEALDPWEIAVASSPLWTVAVVLLAIVLWAIWPEK
jgi:hypothetical protein